MSFAACVLSIALIGFSPPAHADALDDQKNATANQIAAIQQQVAENEAALDQANAALAAAQQQLAAAQADLKAKQQAVADAKAKDDEMAAQLVVAQQTLKDRQADAVAARAAVTQGLANIAAQQDQIGLIAQTAAQQNTTLLSLSILLDGLDFNQLNNQMQWATTVFTANEHAMMQLQAAQRQLDAAEAEAAVQALKDATAAQLAKTQEAQVAAANAAAAVQNKVTANQQAQLAANAALKQAEAKLTSLNAQLAQIESQIKARLVASQQPASETSPTPSDSGLAIAVEAQLVETWGGGTYLWGGGHASLADLQNRLAHQFKGGSSYICYSGNCPRTPNGYGVDCSGFVRAVIYGATGHDIGQFLASYSSAVRTGAFIRLSSSSQAKPGDIFIHDGVHTGVIIANDTAHGKLSTVEARTTYLGIGPSTQYYSSGYGIWRYTGPVGG